MTHAALQVVPHAPQLFGSVCSFTHAPLHTVSPLGHAQLPLWQVPPVSHVVPQAPQLFGSVCSSTHALPQHAAPWQMKYVTG
jgi:hypothetical protein